MTRSLSLVPKLAAGSFFAAAAAFFVLNPLAFKQLDALNLLQFNLPGVNYAFVMALFAYALPGALLTGYFGWHLVHAPARFRAEAAVLLVAGTLLLQLGAVSAAPASAGRTRYLLLLTWLFPTLHGVAWVRGALTGGPGEWRGRACAALGLYLLYRVPGSALFGTHDVQANLPIALCFVWYVSRCPLFQSPLTPVQPGAPAAAQ